MMTTTTGERQRIIVTNRSVSVLEWLAYPPGVSIASAERVAAGRAALARGDWVGARVDFEAVLAEGESPEALEGLARACWWLDDITTMSGARERAYRLYRQRDDVRGAARVACQLAREALLLRGEPAVMSGWVERARRLLADLGECPEHAVLAAFEALFAYLFTSDVELARVRAADASGIARRLGIVDLELLARALEGASMVAEGDVIAGMRVLDETTAAAIGGEIEDVEMIAQTCCFMIFACERVRDFDRAGQWCTQMKEFCRRSGLGSLFAICRTHYATVLTERGEWGEAEEELLGAATMLELRPGQAAHAIVRLGELRRRQGRQAEAAELFERASFLPMAQVCQAELALDLGDPEAASAWAERFLRQVPESDRLQRVHGFEVLARARAQLGDLDGARAAIAELEGSAASGLLGAGLAFCRGVVEAAAGNLELARSLLEDAVDGFEQGGLVFEVAEARIALADVLRQLGRPDPAERESQLAAKGYERLGVRRARASAGGLLSRREQEVLRLVAGGLSDRQIAERLVLSPHTVHRHVSNILLKLGLTSRAAAAAQAARDGLL